MGRSWWRDLTECGTLETRPGCERDGGQLSVSGHLEGPGQGRIPPEGPSPGASDLLQLSGHLRLAFLEPRAPTLGRWLAQQCFQLTLTPLPAPGDKKGCQETVAMVHTKDGGSLDNLSTAQVEYSEDQQAMLKVRRGRGLAGRAGAGPVPRGPRPLTTRPKQCDWMSRVGVSGSASRVPGSLCPPVRRAVLVTTSSGGWVERWSQGRSRWLTRQCLFQRCPQSASGALQARQRTGPGQPPAPRLCRRSSLSRRQPGPV